MRTRVKMLRWPRVLRNPLRRFFLNTRSFGPRASPSTTPRTCALATNGAPARMSPGVFLDEQHLVEGELRPGLAGRSVDLDNGAGRHLELAATGLNDGVHGRFLG